MATFTYHRDSKTMSCVCGKEITGRHTCSDILKVKECTNNNKDCTICREKEEKRLFEDQWMGDEDGYNAPLVVINAIMDYLNIAVVMHTLTEME